jgi:hypothetical protein
MRYASAAVILTADGAQPHARRERSDNEQFARKGAFEHWTRAGTLSGTTICLVTTSSQPGIVEIHERDPSGDYRTWIKYNRPFQDIHESHILKACELIGINADVAGQAYVPPEFLTINGYPYRRLDK